MNFKSRKAFFYCINECNEQFRDSHDLHYYRKIIDMHRHYNDLEELLNNESIYYLIYSTLEKWNMNQQGARLNNPSIIKKSILSNKPFLLRLYKYRLESIKTPMDESDEKAIMTLGLVFKGLDIMKSKRRIVGVSKALHFLLPDLVPPMDGRYTMSFHYGYNKYDDDIEKETKTFKDILLKANGIARKFNLTADDVDGVGWNTSIPKLIDNAIIGLLKHIERCGAERTFSIIQSMDY